MSRIPQEAYQRQRAIKWAEKHGVTSAALRYQMSRKTVYKWIKRYDGTVNSLMDQPQTPHHCPRKQTEQELRLVARLHKRFGNDLLLAYQHAAKEGYKRSYGCFKRTANKLASLTKKRKRRQNKPYQRAEYPGQKIRLSPQTLCKRTSQ